MFFYVNKKSLSSGGRRPVRRTQSDYHQPYREIPPELWGLVPTPPPPRTHPLDTRRTNSRRIKSAAVSSTIILNMSSSVVLDRDISRLSPANPVWGK